jgi:hypothetical protein
LALLAPFDRPLALRMLGQVRRVRSTSPDTPPVSGADAPVQGSPTARRTPIEIATFLTHVLLADAGALGSHLAELEASVDEGVVVWSPSICTRSRTELVSALLEGDNALTDLHVSIVGASSLGSTVYVEWHLDARFNNVGFLNDDLLVEPSGGGVEAAGVLVVELVGSRAVQIRCYYDGLGLLEQMVRSPQG